MSWVRTSDFLVVLVVVSAMGSAAVGAAAAGADSHADTSAVAPPAPANLIEADSVEFRVTVYENASARWTFTYTRTLENESERDQFESFAKNFNENDTEVWRDFKAQASDLASTGRNATGREMRANSFEKSAHLGGSCLTQDDCGTVKMSFIWTEFARVTGENVTVDDVFEGGLFLGSSQQLVFETGPNLTFVSASPNSFTPSGTSLGNSESITWQGKKEFSDNRPRVVFAPEGNGGTDSGDGSGGNGGDGTGGDGTGGNGQDGSGGDGQSNGSEFPMPILILGGAVVVLVGVGAAFTMRRGGLRAANGGTTTETAGDAGIQSTTRPGDEAAASASSVPEEELMTDEDRVVNLLEENGGRMKQVNIVEETGWSKSKVSMLLSEMDDEGEISKLRVGRENIISLAGHEPDAAGSPHED